MNLTKEQQDKVTRNMGLVGKVIKDKVHSPINFGVYTYDDLYQIGCIGLCQAAAADKGGCFSTFAYRIIWNEICEALIYSSKRAQTERSVDPTLLSSVYTNDRGDFTDYSVDCENDGVNSTRRNDRVVDNRDIYYAEESEIYVGIDTILNRAENDAKGVTAKGIRAIRMIADGYSSKEIGNIMGASANNVTAWISKARKFLKSRPEIASL